MQDVYVWKVELKDIFSKNIITMEQFRWSNKNKIHGKGIVKERIHNVILAFCFVA